MLTVTLLCAFFGSAPPPPPFSVAVAGRGRISGFAAVAGVAAEAFAVAGAAALVADAPAAVDGINGAMAAVSLSKVLGSQGPTMEVRAP
jgi:hypothetical protein